MSTSKRFAEICRELAAATGGETAAKLMRRRKKKCERYSKVRNRIAHSRCAGTWNSEYVVFAVFEREGASNPVIECIPLQEMRRAEKWGREMLRLSLQVVDLPDQ